MARLFISTREIHLINDWTKEFTKDVVGQKIYYYAVSTMDSNIHAIYNESIGKAFEKPIMIDALVGQPEWQTKNNNFGVEQVYNVEVWIQARDLIDKSVKIHEGDYFTYGDAVFEIQSALPINNIFGQEEYGVGYHIKGRLARVGLFDAATIKAPGKDSKLPISEQGEGGIQTKFEQQRGLKENSSGATADHRQVRDRLKEEMAPIALEEGPMVVDTSSVDEDKEKSTSFNNEPPPATPNIYGE